MIDGFRYAWTGRADMNVDLGMAVMAACLRRAVVPLPPDVRHRLQAQAIANRTPAAPRSAELRCRRALRNLC